MVRSRGPRPRHAGRHSSVHLPQLPSRFRATNSAWRSRREPAGRQTSTSGLSISPAMFRLARRSIREGTRRRCGRRTARTSRSRASDRARFPCVRNWSTERPLMNCSSRGRGISRRATGPRMVVSSCSKTERAGNFDLWVLPLFGDRKPFPLLRTEFNESSAVFAPDGRWIAYSSNDGAASATSTFNRFPEQAGRNRSPRTVGASLSGERTARNCSTSEPTGR